MEADSRAEYLHTAYAKALSLRELVDILFEWFKINSGEWEYQLREYDVNELTRQIIIGFLPIFDRENIHLELCIPEEEWFLLLDKLAYERVVGNLIGNALKHGKCSELAVKLQRTDDCLSLGLIY